MVYYDCIPIRNREKEMPIIATELELDMINHKELIEVLKEHGDAFDSFGTDDSNFILDEGNGHICKTGDIQVKQDFLTKVLVDQNLAVHASRHKIEAEISRLEDVIGKFQIDYPY